MGGPVLTSDVYIHVKVLNIHVNGHHQTKKSCEGLFDVYSSSSCPTPSLVLDK